MVTPTGPSIVKKEVIKSMNWFKLSYANMEGGESETESCQSYEHALQLLQNKPKSSNSAFSWSSIDKELSSKDVNNGAVWSD